MLMLEGCHQVGALVGISDPRPGSMIFFGARICNPNRYLMLLRAESDGEINMTTGKYVLLTFASLMFFSGNGI